MALPTRGQHDWDDDLNNYIAGLEARLQAAESGATSAQSNANYAKNTVDSVGNIATAKADAQTAATQAVTSASTASGAATTASDAATTALSARDDAAASAAAAQAVGNTNDTIIEGRIKDPTSKTATALTATYATVGEVRSKIKTANTDAANTAIFQAELDALYDAGGGIIIVPSSPLGAVPYKLTNLTLKNDAATLAKMPTIVIRGQGMHWSGRGAAPQGGTILEFTGTDTYGLIKSNALGALALTGVTLRNTTTANSTPFIYTTNTTLHVFRCAFYGAKTGAACDQDAIILGGINQVEGGSGWTDGFQGYGTVIQSNFFSGIRRAVYGRAFANAVRIEDNTVWSNCGNSGGAAFEFDGRPPGGTGGQSVAGGTIANNLIEVTNYAYGIRARNAVGLSILANDGYDSGSSTIALVLLEDTAIDCNVEAGYFAAGTKPYLIDVNGSSRFVEINASGYPSSEPKPKFNRAASYFAGSSGVGPIALATSGEQAYIRSSAGGKIFLSTRVAITVTDGVTTNGSRTVTSATAAFAATDVGWPISGTGIPSGSIITKLNSATSVEISKPATADGTGVSITFGRFSATETQQVAFTANHMQCLGTVPTVSGSTGSGSSPTITIAGTDMAGTITLTTGTSPAVGVAVNVTTAQPYGSLSRPMISPADANAAAAGVYAARVNNTVWKINSGATPLAASTTYTWNYWVPQA